MERGAGVGWAGLGWSAVPGLRISRGPGTATCQPVRVCCSWTPHFAESRDSNLPASPVLLFLDSAFRGAQEQQPASQSGSAAMVGWARLSQLQEKKGGGEDEKM